MEILKSYFSIIDPRLLEHVKGKPSEFIRLFREIEYLSEDAFKKRICGEKHGFSYYSELKSRTIKILQGLAMIGAAKGTNEVKKNLDNCRKYFALGQKFLGNGQRKEGIRLIKEAYKIAIDYDLTHLACELSSILHHDYVYYHPNKRKANFYSNQVEKYLQEYTAEKKAERCFLEVIAQLSRSSNPEPIKKSINEIAIYKGTSLQFKVHEGTLKILYYFSIGDYRAIIDISQNVLDCFKNKKGVYRSHYYFFYKSLAVAQMALGHYDDAKYHLNQSSQYVNRKSLNDYLVRFYQILNALHSRDFVQAHIIFKQCKGCPFKNVREQFAIIEAYLCYLAHVGILKLDRPFRLGKFFNETFKARTDKKGDNINILIAELLVFLARNRGKFIDRIEAMKTYSYRHLTGADTRRAKRFLKILFLLPKANFHPVALERLAKRSIENLKKHPIRMGENYAVEIIPFEILLDLILLQLKRKVA